MCLIEYHAMKTYGLTVECQEFLRTPEPLWPLWGKENFFPIPGIKPCFLDCPAHIRVNMIVNVKHVAAKLRSNFRETD